MNKHKRRTTPGTPASSVPAPAFCLKRRYTGSFPLLLPLACPLLQPPVRIFPARNSGRNQMSSIEKVRPLRYSSSPAGVVKAKRSL